MSLLLPQIARPSYQSGFYSPVRGGLPAHPELWEGRVGAWSMVIGAPSTVFVKEQAGRSSDGVLTNTTAGNWGCFRGHLSVGFANPRYIHCGTGNLSGYTNYSFEGWCAQEFSTTSGAVIGNRVGTGLIGQLTLQSDYPQFTVRDDASNLGAAAASVPVVANQWYHLAGVRRGNTLELYVDGDLAGTDTVSFGTISEGSVSIGHIVNGTSSNYFEGHIAEASVYARALSHQEIRKLALRPGISYERKRFFTGFSSPVQQAPGSSLGAPLLLSRVQSRPSYQNGYYSPIIGGQAAEPELWKGCIGAYAPELGHTGSILRSHSHGNSNAALGSDLDNALVMSDRGPAFQKKNSNTTFTSSRQGRGWGSQGTLMAWVRFVASGAGFSAHNHIVTDNSGSDLGLSINTQNGVNRIGGSVDNSWGGYFVNGVTIGKWYHVALVANTAAGVQTAWWYTNGIQVATTGVFSLSAYDGIQTGTTNLGTNDPTVQFQDIRAYDRVVTPGELRRIVRSPGAPYQRKRRIFFSTSTELTSNSQGSWIPQRQNARPSLREGYYAPTIGGSPKYPGLWKDRFLSVAPVLGATGSIVRDVARKTNDMTLQNVTLNTVWSTRQQYRCLELDGTDDYLQSSAAAVNGPSLANGFSMEAWLYKTTTVSVEVFFDCGTSGKNDVTWYQSVAPATGVIAFNRSNGNTFTYVQGNNNSGFSGNGGWSVMPTGRWVHVCLTVSAGGVLRLWYDGVQQGNTVTITSGQMPIITSSSVWRIGATVNTAAFGTTNELNGGFATGSVYCRELRPNEIKLLASNPLVSYERNRRMWYGTGTTATPTPGGVTYPKLERRIRGLNRGIMIGSH